MHMINALVSPVVGGTMLAVTAGVGGYCVKKLEKEQMEKKLPLMGGMGAFVFATQMLNFAIPGTGASGHLCGGILLAAVLGPYAGFLTMATILLVQALFFGDGGLLAFGANLFNMGFVSCFVAYPLIFKPLMKREQGFDSKKIGLVALLASIVALQLGAFGVVIETAFSGKTAIPFVGFVARMQPIHLAIGIVEGCITGAVLNLVYKTTPHFTAQLYESETKKSKYGWLGLWLVIILVITGALSHLASTNPDGLEWSISKVTDAQQLEQGQISQVHEVVQNLQESIVILPDYHFKQGTSGTTVAGIIGSGITFLSVMLIGEGVWILNKKRVCSK